MQTPQQRLDHAEHNLKLANKLLEEGEFLDWVVTSSFYAAIHYCRYKLFPLEDKNTPGTSLCDNFDQFTYENRLNGKHQVLADLIRINLDRDLYLKFKILKSSAMTSRYSNHDIPLETAKISFASAETISNHCKGKKSCIKKNDLNEFYFNNR